MSEGIVFCLEKQELDDAARLMEMKQVRRLPVINGKKRMTGMLSLGDVYNAGPPHLSGEVMQSVSAHHS
jgi:CBS domain-containing protein